MKKLFLILISMLFLFSTVSAEEEVEKKKLYKWVDKNGSVHFSDEPYPGAVEIELKEAPTIKMSKPSLKSVNHDGKNAGSSQSPITDVYQLAELSEPLDNGVVRNNASIVTLTAKIVPELSSEHSIRFFLDGKPVGEDPKATSVTVESVSYGEHSANFVILDAQGKQLRASNTHHFNLLHIVNQKNRNN